MDKKLVYLFQIASLVMTLGGEKVVKADYYVEAHDLEDATQQCKSCVAGIMAAILRKCGGNPSNGGVVMFAQSGSEDDIVIYDEVVLTEKYPHISVTGTLTPRPITQLKPGIPEDLGEFLESLTSSPVPAEVVTV